MNFDQTYIAIRQRSLLEILDLAFHVIRDHFRPLCLLWLLGAVPFMIANWLAIGWLADDVYDPERMALYHITMILLVCNKAQIATTFMTSYLGQATFSPQPTMRGSIRAALRVNPIFFWVHGILRMAVPVLVVAFLLDGELAEESFGWMYFLLVCLALFGLLIRCIRPFISEILLLEKTPIRPKERNQIGFALRSASLHKAASSELTGRFILISILAIPLTVTFLGTLLLIDSWLNLFVSGSAMPLIIYGPISLWMTAGLATVTRFLSYIDIRIRQEGWEVELRLRAEAIRLERALV